MKYITRKRILQFSTARTSRNWLKRIKFSRYENLSLYKFLKIFIANLSDDEVMNRANGVSFSFILAIFPTIIFLFTLIPYISDVFPDITKDSIMVFFGQVIPSNMYDAVSATILDIVNNQRGGLLTFGFFLAMYLSTNGMLSLMRAFNSCYRTLENRNWFRMRLTSMGLTLLLALVLFAAIAILIVGQFLVNNMTRDIADISHVNLDKYSLYFLFTLRFLVIFIVFFIAISFIYYFGPAIHYNWSLFTIGSLSATLGILGISYGFSYYITHFASYNKVYGSIGALIALMAWVQLVTIILLFGYEINASLHYGRKMEAIEMHRRQSRKSKEVSVHKM